MNICVLSNNLILTYFVALLFPFQVQAFRKGSRKRKRGGDTELDVKDLVQHKGRRQELVDLADIEMVHKKRKHDKASRLASVMAGREDREKFGSRKQKQNENASTTNKEKARKKNFMMLKHKLKKKAKRSFVEKQKQMKQSMMRSKKFL